MTEKAERNLTSIERRIAVVTRPDRNKIAALAAKHGLFAIQRGMRLNSSYTPSRCRAVAEQLTGKTFRARDYSSMIAALEEYLNA